MNLFVRVGRVLVRAVWSEGGSFHVRGAHGVTRPTGNFMVRRPSVSNFESPLPALLPLGRGEGVVLI